jgi:hypothetical protein
LLLAPTAWRRALERVQERERAQDSRLSQALHGEAADREVSSTVSDGRCRPSGTSDALFGKAPRATKRLAAQVILAARTSPAIAERVDFPAPFAR